MEPHLPGKFSSGESYGRKKYAVVLDRVFRRVVSESSRLERQRALAPSLLKDLLAVNPAQRSLVVHNSPKYQTWPLAEELISYGRASWTDDTDEAESSALLALEIAERLDATGLRARLLNDLRAEAWSCVANCRRIRSDIHGSTDAFQRAEALLDLGSGDSLERARLLDLKASLMASLRDYSGATSLLQDALTEYRRSGESHLEGRALLKQAKFARDKGSPDEAFLILGRALEIFDEHEDSALQFLAKKNQVVFLTELGRLDEAQALLPEVRELARRHGSRLERLRLIWTEGILRMKLGQKELAREALEQVRDGFIDAGIGYDVALVSLDLALLCMESDETAEVRRLASETMRIFSSIGVQRELVMAWNLFRMAAERDAVTITMVNEIARRIRQNGFQL